ncbi:hypothetical protein RRG08_063878 [Elysia crispata]|uniref:Uncharacterized protein n=1 Tax=Elysia crispata TaxID=231223 RepID=A0AAE1DVH8_9GAST|nr:hypothetical protein RRG08_063878 [Elysia crispata]
MLIKGSPTEICRECDQDRKQKYVENVIKIANRNMDETPVDPAGDCICRIFCKQELDYTKAASVAWEVLALESEWNENTRKLVLDIHNNFRRQELGFDVNKLSYGKFGLIEA